MNKITFQSPAKVNLHLRVTGRRANGYHDLVTLFHRISLADTITIEKKPSGFAFTSNANLPEREGNLFFKAYTRLQGKIPNLPGVKIKLTKRIPIGAGLGGGSSNAAFFLLGMKKICGLKISAAQLKLIAAKVGADVPFFMENKTQALAWGIGDKMKILPAKKKLHFLLLPSPRSLSTPLVYKKYDAKAKKLNAKRELQIAKKIAEFWSRGAVQKAGALQGNDLEAPAVSLRPDIGMRLRLLRTQSNVPVMMSGSGPTIFAVSTDPQAILHLRRKLPASLKKHALACFSQ